MSYFNHGDVVRLNREGRSAFPFRTERVGVVISAGVGSSGCVRLLWEGSKGWPGVVIGAGWLEHCPKKIKRPAGIRPWMFTKRDEAEHWAERRRYGLFIESEAVPSTF